MMLIGGQITNSSRIDCDSPTVGGGHNLLLGQESQELFGQGMDPFQDDRSYETGLAEQGNYWYGPMMNVTHYRVPQPINEVVLGG
jgi:hypothetical protein